MKEIKFRAIDNITKKWIYSNGYYFDGINYWFITPNIDSLAIGFADHHIVLKNTISQYIGRKDKNGIDIYKGDIICWDDLRGGIISKIIFEHNYGWHPYNLYNRNWWEMSEVVGNIYENPELLE